MKSLYFSLIIIFVIPIPLQAQILNGGFEQWVSGEPVNWKTNNINDPKISLIPITKTSDAHSGSFALKGEVVTVLDSQFTFSPVLFSGPDGVGFSFSGQPKQIRGYYQFNPVGGDAFSISIFLGENQNLLGSGEGTIYTPTGPDYQEMVIDIIYTDTVTIPNQILFIFQILPVAGQQANVGTYFYIDDFPTISFIKPPGEPENAGTGNLIFDAGAGNIVFIAGEKDTIKWSGGGALNVDIEYSVDNGATYQQIVNNYPADSSRYFWAVPGSLLTREAIINIKEAENTSNKIKSINFSIKPWQLTRLINDEFDLFRPFGDGWKLP